MRRKRRGHGASPIGEDEATVPAAGRRSVFGPGDRIAGRYRVVRRIAAGGMGEVYEVDDAELHEVVALKTIRSDVAEGPAALERFRREIQLARKITHPNVCRIFDVGFHRPDDGEAVPFLTMELLAGETLTAWLRRHGRIAPDVALSIADQMAAGLEAAHRAGIVHRDFKAGNVMLVPDGGRVRTVITDFGLAKALAADPALDSGALTGPRPVGTPAYMAPEQVTGGPVDERTDIYAFGIVLFEMVTGRLPFVADTPLAIAIKRVTEAAPSPAALVPDLDPVWVAVIERCLARDPAGRYPSIEAAMDALHAEDLETVAQSRYARPRPRPRPGRSRSRWYLLAIPLVAAIAGAGYGVWRWQRQGDPPSVVRGIASGDLAMASQRPAPSGTPHERAREHLRRWEGVAARDLLDDLVASAPGDIGARVALCQAHLLTKDMAQATTVAQRGLASPGASAPARRLLEACLRTARDDDRGAAALYRDAFAESPDRETGIRLAVSQARARDATGVENTLAKLLDLDAASRDDARIQLLDADARELRGDYPGARALYAKAAARAHAEGLPMVEATASGREASMLRSLGELRAARDLAQRVTALHEAAGERGYGALVVHSAVLYDLGEHRQNVAMRERMVELAEQAGNEPAAVSLLVELASSRFLLGDHARARREIAAAAKQCRELKLAACEFSFMLGWEHLHFGEPRVSLEHTRRELTPYPTDKGTIAYMEWDYGEAALLAGDLATARKSLEKATDVASAASFFTSAECTRVLLAMTALAEGKAAEAEALSHRAIRELDRMGVRDCRVRGRVVRARALRVLGHGDQATPILAEAASISTEDVWIRWELEVAQAEAELARGDRAAAVARLERIIAEADGFEMPYASLAAAVLLGELELAGPSTMARGKARLQETARRARAVGQRLIGDRASALLRAIR